jgi:L-ascorbate metabolism protein UlaG (beta-lactamase superfamily)
MLLRYYGHSLFTLTMESGFVLLTDPYGDFFDYPHHRLKADVVTVSHHHRDHDSLEMIVGQPTVVDQEGVSSPVSGLLITGVPSKHDAQNGQKRGDNMIFVIEAEGLKLVHLGDLGHVLNERQRNAIGRPDVLMTPVGGTYSTDAAAAAENVRLLRPRVTIPMHYRTQYDEQMPIDTEEPFLQLMGANPTPMPLCRLTKGDLQERPEVLLMAVLGANSA